MYLRTLQVDSFRNLVSQRVSFARGINLLIGDNGQGKTNLLEAVHLLSSLRSFRPSRLSEMIARGLSTAEISAEIEHDGLPVSLKIAIEPNGRRLWIGQKPIPSVADFMGKLSAVAFTPDDLSMVKGAPALRRRFADRAIFLTRPGHLQAVRQFSQALRARNRLLSAGGRPDRLQLDSFSQPLARWGAQVTAERRQLVEELQASFCELVMELSAGQLDGGLVFRAGWRDDRERDSQALRQQLEGRLETDLRRGTTSLGPQLDDFEIQLEARPARRYASQGQQRVCAVALLLTVVRRAMDEGYEQPIILLDDVSSELDSGMRARLFASVASLGGQVLVTSTDPRLSEELGPDLGCLFKVHQGLATPEPGYDGREGVRA